MISILDVFKIALGPSSSHTTGPMNAANRFVELLKGRDLSDLTRLEVQVFGSLSLTGRGHGTDIAILLGLCGFEAKSIPLDLMEPLYSSIKSSKKLPFGILDPQIQNHKIDEIKALKIIDFDYAKDFIFNSHFLPKHENAMTLTAHFKGSFISQTYYSIGGGFVLEDSEFDTQNKLTPQIPMPYKNAQDILNHCSKNELSIAEFMRQNELALHDEKILKKHIKDIFTVMQECIYRGLRTDGILKGGLRVKRRAKQMYEAIRSDKSSSLAMLSWINIYAFAVSEENAAGYRVVTAPTNGACGIIPAVLNYALNFLIDINANLDEILGDFFLASGAIGSLYKMNASISGAEVGCQGEVGVACSMAAAGLAQILGGSAAQVCTAAEIAMEHNLGLTCDPIAGLVQIPCIERNAIASTKAINAAKMALLRNDEGLVRLDDVILAMFETGKDMHSKYRETSLGGLAKVFCH
ncbi:MAG: L-serine ammonia-lyase [Helicobacter sp.]|nr:L-serine ammonia-lyase [Helicobacter sp.]